MERKSLLVIVVFVVIVGIFSSVSAYFWDSKIIENNKIVAGVWEEGLGIDKNQTKIGISNETSIEDNTINETTTNETVEVVKINQTETDQTEDVDKTINQIPENINNETRRWKEK